MNLYRGLLKFSGRGVPQYFGLLGFWIICSAGLSFAEEVLPSGFVRLSLVAPSIRQDIRYAGASNFMGRPVAGYKAPVCILSIPAAKALAKVQAEALLAGYALKVYDCYRPQRAVEDFATWGKGLEDQSMKRWFYPDVPNQTLFKQGYISEKSGHSRGSTVDLTLVPIIVARESDQPEVARMDDCRHPQNFRFRDDSLDMGTAFDCFDPLAHTENPTISEPARANRLYLKRLMESNGFRNLPEEWWHYTLISEPFPDRYFDFEVR